MLLSATRGHGYRKAIYDRNDGESCIVADPQTVIDSFHKELTTELRCFDGFMMFLSGIVQGRRPQLEMESNSSTRALSQLFQVEEIGIFLKKEIASYLGVPTLKYLSDLREVWILGSEYEYGLKEVLCQTIQVTDDQFQ